MEVLHAVAEKLSGFAALEITEMFWENTEKCWPQKVTETLFIPSTRQAVVACLDFLILPLVFLCGTERTIKKIIKVIGEFF